MQKNVGGYDRIARFVVGPVLIVVGIAALGGLLSLSSGVLGSILAAVALIVGVVLTVTALTRKCPLNALLGLDTYRGSAPSGASGEEAATESRPN